MFEMVTARLLTLVERVSWPTRIFMDAGVETTLASETTQCAAVSTHCAAISEPPQNCP